MSRHYFNYSRQLVIWSVAHYPLSVIGFCRLELKKYNRSLSNLTNYTYSICDCLETTNAHITPATEVFCVIQCVCVGFLLCTNLSWLPRPTPLSRHCVLSCAPRVLSCVCPLVMLRLRRFWLRLSCAISRSRWLLDSPYFSSKQRSGSALLIGWKMMAPTTLEAQAEKEIKQTIIKYHLGACDGVNLPRLKSKKSTANYLRHFPKYRGCVIKSPVNQHLILFQHLFSVVRQLIK